MIVKFAVTNYESTADGVWSSTGTDITDAYDVVINNALGETKDTFTFKVPNIRNSRIASFDPQDNVNINLLINNDTATGSNLLINGLLKAVKEDVNDKGKFLRIEGVSFAEIAGNALVFVEQFNVNCMQFLEAALSSVRLRNGNFGISWNEDNPTVKSTGIAFPALEAGGSIKAFDKSLSWLLNKYLQNEYTGDGRYYWYINNSKELVIRKRFAEATDGTLTEGVDFKTAKYDINAEDVRNFIVVKCGNDYFGRPISTRYDDPVSRAKHGFRYYMLVDTQIAQTIKAQGAFSSTTNEAFKIAVKEAGVAAGAEFARAHNEGFRQITITMSPNVSYSIGDKVAVTSHSYNITSLPMRIKEISWDIDSTIITLTEEALI